MARATVLCASLAIAAGAKPSVHEVFTLDFGWKFHYGDVGASNRTGQCQYTIGYDVGQGIIALVTTATYAACCNACAGEPACIAWDWDSSGTNECYLKNNTIGNASRLERVTGTLPPNPPSNASLPGFDDSSWPIVNVPHDYSINQTFASTNDANHAYLPKVGDSGS